MMRGMFFGINLVLEIQGSTPQDDILHDIHDTTYDARGVLRYQFSALDPFQTYAEKNAKLDVPVFQSPRLQR